MKHEIVFIGKTKDSFIQSGIEEYSSRLKHYTNIQINILKDKSGGKTTREAIEIQGKHMLSTVPQGAVIVALDSRGQQFTSESFSQRIVNWELNSVKQVTYLIGGPDGISENILKSAGLVLSFSKMTFTHDMVRLFLTEQLYRAYTIKAGERYHK